MANLTDPRDIIIAPVVSEKSYGLMEQNVYTFFVNREANKTQIKIAIEQIFDVKVASVNTINREGKRKRTRTVMVSARPPSALLSRCVKAPSTSSAVRPRKASRIGKD